MENFYSKFQVISKFPLWPNYLRRVYEKTISDADKLDVVPITNRENFRCLLCGVSGEITAKEYINFVNRKNPNGHITIVDLGKNQIESVKNFVDKNYPGHDIEVKQANALDLSFIESKSVDWIDTDGFFSYFNKNQLLDLFIEWKRILKDDGYITFRELTTEGFFSTIANRVRDRVSKVYMGVSLNLHTIDELIEDFKKTNFSYSRGKSPIPYLHRYCLVNR